MNSSLARFIPTSMNVFKVKKEAWNNINDRHFVLNDAQMKRLSESEYEVIKRIGDRLYGDR